MSSSLQLYVKTWCPWCVSAIDFLDSRGFRYQLLDVESNRQAFATMVELSGQRLTPTLVVNQHLVLADFGPDELALFLQKHQISP